MKFDTIGDPDFFLKSARQSYQFLLGTFCIGSAMLMIAILLVKKLVSGSLPFTTAFALVIAIFLLAGWWRIAWRRHEEIELLLRSREELSNPKILPLLRACADLIQRGLFMTALVTIMLLLGFFELLR